jgi:hypothetical protein
MTVFIQKGDAPMTYRQAVKRGLRYFEAEKAYWEREQGIVQSDPIYIAWASQWVSDNLENEANNLFNHALFKYRAAVDRLSKYRLADGRPEVYEDQPTGEIDPETGVEIFESVLVQTAIDPLPAQVEETIYDDEGNATTTLVDNPAIVQDEAERAAAQDLINLTPQEVKDFAL